MRHAVAHGVGETPVFPGGAVAASRLGLHTTDEELVAWRDRWANGVSGDTFLNTRITDERTRVTNNRNTFVGNPAAHNWQIPDSTRDADGYLNDINVQTQRDESARMRDAAFWALVSDATSADKTSVLNSIRDILDDLPGKVRHNFNDNVDYHPTSRAMTDAAVPGFSIAHVMVTTLHTYDYLLIAEGEGLVSLTSAWKTTMDDWFKQFARYCEPAMTWRANLPFENRLGGVYTLTGQYTDPAFVWAGVIDGNPFWSAPVGGSRCHNTHERFVNRRGSCIRFSMLAAAKYDDTIMPFTPATIPTHPNSIDAARIAPDDGRTLGQRCVIWQEDYIKFSVYPDGAYADSHRQDGTSPDPVKTMFSYMALQHTHSMTAVDAWCRRYGPALLDYTTVAGAHDTDGAPDEGYAAKSFRYAAEVLTRYADNAAYRDRTAHVGTKMDLQLDARNGGIHDRFIVGNLRWQDARIKSFYRGELHPWKVNGNGTNDLNDSWSYPAPYLMWAGLEGAINPYPAGA